MEVNTQNIGIQTTYNFTFIVDRAPVIVLGYIAFIVLLH